MFSALATAEDIVFLTSWDILFSEKVKSLIAILTFFPTIDFNIGFFLVIGAVIGAQVGVYLSQKFSVSFYK